MIETFLPLTIQQCLPSLSSTRHLRYDEICVHAKYFMKIKENNTHSTWAWYLLEGEEQADGNWLFWGFADKREKNFEEFSLFELKGIAESWNTSLIVDSNFNKNSLSMVFEKIGVKWYPGDW